MAKRFTDTKKWNKKWYRELGSALRDVRQYVLDHCCAAGIWEVDFETLKHFTGQRVTLDDVYNAFRGEIVELSDEKIFIPAFIEFQYGELSEESRPHASVIRILSSKRLPNSPDTLWQGYLKGYLTLKDKEQDKDKDKDKEQESVSEKSDRAERDAKLEAIYEAYPKRPGSGKSEGMKSLSRQLQSGSDFDECLRAAQNYRAHCERQQTEPNFIKTFKVWAGSRENARWREWVEVQADIYQLRRVANITGIVER